MSFVGAALLCKIVLVFWLCYFYDIHFFFFSKISNKNAHFEFYDQNSWLWLVATCVVPSIFKFIFFFISLFWKKKIYNFFRKKKVSKKNRFSNLPLLNAPLYLFASFSKKMFLFWFRVSLLGQSFGNWIDRHKSNVSGYCNQHTVR